MLSNDGRFKDSELIPDLGSVAINSREISKKF